MFLTVLWQTGKMGTFLSQMVSSFVSSLGKKLAARDPIVGTLGKEILIALTTLETLVPGSLGKGKDLNCADVWLASLGLGPENLLDVCVCSPRTSDYIDPIDLVQLRLPTLLSSLWVLGSVILCWSWRPGITCGIVCCSSALATTSARKNQFRWPLLLLCALQ